MNTCDTCKWWFRETWEPRCGGCSNPKLNEDPPSEDGLLGGEPADYTGIACGPKFGCVHHQPK